MDVNTAESSQPTSSQSVTGCVPVPGSDLPGPGYVGVGISNVNQSVTSCVAAPGNDLPGPRGLLDRRFYLGSSVSASAPTAPVTFGISFDTRSCPGSDPQGRRNSSQFPRFRRQPGHLQSPPHYLPRRTVPDSSSSFYSSNFWYDPTTFVCSPPLPRKENPGAKDPRARAPNCRGEGGRRMTQSCLYDFDYEHKTLSLC